MQQPSWTSVLGWIHGVAVRDVLRVGAAPGGGGGGGGEHAPAMPVGCPFPIWQMTECCPSENDVVFRDDRLSEVKIGLVGIQSARAFSATLQLLRRQQRGHF